MKTFVLLATLIIIIAPALWAQGDQPECDFCGVSRDFTCDGPNNCVSTTFTPACTVNVNFWCETVCDNSVNPTHCRVTANLRQSSSIIPIATCENGDEEHCWTLQTGANDITLYADVEYVLTACLQSCAGDDCCGNCRAVATVKTKHGTCGAP